MAYTITNAVAGTQPIAKTDTVQMHTLGTRVNAVDPVYGGGEFIYLAGVASTVVGSWVLFNEDNFSTTLLAPNDIGQVATALSINNATTAYGWYQVTGKAIGLAAAAFADNANVYSTAVVGTINSAIVAGDRVKKCKSASAVGTPSTGLAEFEMDRPFVDDALAA